MDTAQPMVPAPATHTSLDLFERPSVLVNFDSGIEVEQFPLYQVDSPSIEFELRTDRNIYLDLRSIKLHVSISVVHVDGTKLTKEKDGNVYLVSNTLHSLFNNVDVSINGNIVETSNGLYSHKAYLSTEWSHTEACKSTKLTLQGYRYDADPSQPATAQALNNAINTSEPLFYFGKLAIDFFSTNKMLYPGNRLNIRLVKNLPDFVVQNADVNKYGIRFNRVSLYVRQHEVSEHVHMALSSQLARQPASYYYMSQIAKTFIIPQGQNERVEENIFNSKPIRTLGIAMNTNANFNGHSSTTPYHYQKFDLFRLEISRNGLVLWDVKLSDNNTRMYYTTLESLHFEEHGPNIPLHDYKNHFFMLFDLTSTTESNVEVYYPELVGGQIRLKMYFSKALEQPLEVLLLGETLSMCSIKSTDEVFIDGL